ncbi:MAG: hypothetical protein EU529_00835 [Promethearchaeota archaeon]|nr:MAG: hypothetical protein EU529_00835 [Candidatus Lokiarchaeota archaeon]
MKNDQIKIQINQSKIKFPLNTIGIDIGQSLTKIVWLERDNLYLKLMVTKPNFEEIIEFLDSKKGVYKNFNFTGGKAFNLSNKYSKEVETKLYNEFQANIKGIETLYLLNKEKDVPDSLIITIGTGTSIVLKKKSIQHLGGTALGGGLFIGLLKLLFNFNDFQKAMKLSTKGDRYNVDLKVSDIYEPEDDRVDSIFREFTAASFGKINDNFSLNSVQKEDIINSLICIIGENVGIIACEMAENNEIKNLIFCGGFLRNNKVLKNILSLLCRVHNKKAIFLKNSEFCGAIGALLI